MCVLEDRVLGCRGSRVDDDSRSISEMEISQEGERTRSDNNEGQVEAQIGREARN